MVLDVNVLAGIAIQSATAYTIYPYINLRKLLPGTCGLFPFAASSQHLQRTTDKPNVILLLVDDLGWRDLGFWGSKYL